MYAMLMKKENLSNGGFLFNPVTVIEGELNEEYGAFVDKFNHEFCLIDELSFAISELVEGVYFVSTEEELLSKYSAATREEALKYYQDDIFGSFTFGLNSDNKIEKLDIYKLSLSDLKELASNSNLNSSYYNGIVSIPKRKLYMLTQLKDEKDLKAFIEQSVKDFKELERKEREIKDKEKEIKLVNVNTNSKTNIKNKNIRRDIDTDELEAYLKMRVIGQDKNIENLVTVISDNYKTSDPHLIQRPLVMGPSGVGKTETLKLLAEYLNIPFTKYSTPTLSGSGYVGKDIDDILKMAYQNSSRNIKKCEESLIFLDEFDKIANRGLEVSDVAVQNLLLNFLDGTVYDVNLTNYDRIKIDTTFMNIVLGGAFVDILKDKNRKLGFNNDDSLDLTVTDKDIIDFGFIPEIVGRISPKIMYNNLTKEDLKNILKQGKLSPILLKQQFYKEVYGVDLKYTDDYIDAILEIATSNDTGARELKQIVYTSLLDVSHVLQGKSNRGKFSEVIVDKEILSNNKVYTLNKR